MRLRLYARDLTDPGSTFDHILMRKPSDPETAVG